MVVQAVFDEGLALAAVAAAKPIAADAAAINVRAVGSPKGGRRRL